MKLRECITCGSHSFTGNKCDYCGNEYEVTELYVDDKRDMTLYSKTYCDDGTEAYAPKQETWQEKLKVSPSFDYMKSLSNEEINEIYSNLKDGLTPNQIRTAICKEDLVKEQATYEEDDYLEYKAQELTEQNKKVLKIMVWILISIIWFAVTVSIPPLFLATICGLIISVCRKVCKKH